MGKLSLHRDPEVRTTTEYVRELSRLLRLPEAEASAIVDEADAHLRDRAEELVEAGVTPASAEASAVSGFGSARSYARRLSDSFYETAGSRVALLFGRVLLTGVFGVLVTMVVMGLTAFERLGPSWLVSALVGGYHALEAVTVGIVTIAFLARRTHTRLIVVLGAGLTLAELIVNGYYVTALPNGGRLVDWRYLHENIRLQRQDERDVANDLRLLDEGRSVYRSARQPQDIPAELRAGGQYVVPVIWNSRAFNISDPLSLPSPFQRSVPTTSAVRERLGLSNRDPAYSYIPAAVSSMAEAKLRWNRDNSMWRTAKRRQFASIAQEIDEYHAVLSKPDHFDLEAWCLNPTDVYLTLIIAALDFAGAWAGRRAFLILRKLRRRDRDLVI